jgi:hypothetical protein
MMARLTVYIDIPGDRYAVLDRRDEIVKALEPLGIRLSMTDDGTYVYLVDVGIPTISDRLTDMTQDRLTKGPGDDGT